jgi:hypothetical protein
VTLKKFLFRRIERDGKVFLEIADDLMKIHEAYAEMFIERYKKDRRLNFDTEHDATDMRLGIVGQRMFQSLLNEMRVPYIHDEPTFIFPSECLRSADFLVQNFGSIEIKARPANTDTMIIKKSLWDTHVKNNAIPDYVIVLMIDTNEARAEIVGYEHGKEVSKLPNAPHICRYTPCYSKLYADLHPFRELDEALKACSMNARL